ncbi:filament-like plant protein 7 isoform X1 [Arachis stenosperma]|uniref:filament-like plant protein 7 isoform X1 n=1 Tax=Arachis stenosperma TaxID=217475 RepID=UPI0025AC4A12|nr:filament-like plant protein 7 isoform X1 [Arachis stenosperma]
MDHKSWLWRKKSSEKAATDKANNTSKENEEVICLVENKKVQALLAEKEELEKDLKRLNDKLASTISDNKLRDEQVKKQTKIAQEAVTGWEKAEAEMVSMKQYLEESMQQQIVYEERVSHLDGALKECMQQLRFVREEQEQRIQDAVMKVSKEFEQARLVLEEQLSETTEELARSAVENAHLNKSILAKENLIEDLKRQLTQAEADHNGLMIKLEFAEKDNTSLKYEVRVLGKELEIRNEEIEFNRRTADASHKQHLESARKIAKLESECQRLRLLVRKRLPGPAALAKMKNEVEMLGWESLDVKKKMVNSSNVIESSVDNPLESTNRRITTLTEQLHAVQEENKTLKESLNRKASELQFSRSMLARTASKLLQLESQIEEFSKGQVALEQPRSILASHEFSLASMSDVSSDDKVSCAESWPSALVSELEILRCAKQKELLSCRSVGSSDINLMDDFIEMEKLAVISVEKASEPSHASLEADNGIKDLSEIGPDENISEVVGKEIIPVSDHTADFATSNHETCSGDIFEGNIPGWLLHVVKMILERNFVTHKTLDDITEDIKVALGCLNNSDQCEFHSSKTRGHFETTDKPQSSLVPQSGEVNVAEISSIKSRKQETGTDLSKSISKIVELIEGISMPAEAYDDSNPLCRRDGSSDNNLETTTDYMVRVLQWKTSELNNVLQRFLHLCYELLNGKADIENFVAELTTTLDWIMNHCFSLQDVSSIRDAVKKQFDWDETRSENEAQIRMTSHFPEVDKLHLPKQQLSCVPLLTNSDGHDYQTKVMKNDHKEEFKSVNEVNCEAEKEVLESSLQTAARRTEPIMNQLQESEKTIASLRLELQNLKESNKALEGQIQNETSISADVSFQFTEAELKEAHHKVLALEVELENKNHHCEELEARCIELQLQLESMTKECSKDDILQKDKPLQSDWEITAATEKLAECQETILNLGKQLKALASPNDASFFDNVTAVEHNTTTSIITVPPKGIKVKSRSSLLDQMLADNDTKLKVDKASDRSSSMTDFVQPLEKILVLNGLKGQDESSSVNSLAIVRAKKSGGRSLWKKLLGRKKKAKKKAHFLFNT